MSFYGYFTANYNSYDLMYSINPTNIIMIGKHSINDGSYETFRISASFSEIELQKGYIYPKYYVRINDGYDKSKSWWKPSEYQIKYTYASCSLSSQGYTLSYISIII